MGCSYCELDQYTRKLICYNCVDFMNIITVTLGTILNRLPYILIPKIGLQYRKCQTDIKTYDASMNKKEWIFKRFYNIVNYAITNIPFYQEFYKSHNFNIEQLKCFDDIGKVPIVHKSDLIDVPLEQRSNLAFANYLANTGGSTGSPFIFYRSPIQRIKAMAFYHNAWKRLGYKKNKLRLQFVGRQEKQGCIYDFKRNQIRVSAYESFDNVLREITKVNTFRMLEYLQGYPSVLYEFALFCADHKDLYEQSKLPKSLRGIFLNSEYPNPIFRDTIESVFGVKTIASYGLSEGCALAFDDGSGFYEIDQSYSYVEAIDVSGEKHLVGTCYDNYVAPLIRYDTNDVVEMFTSDENILQTFRMDSGGRSGQYILDINDRRVSLTGLIFGKHHQLFSYCTQLQVGQVEKGLATIYYVPKCELPVDFDPALLFDTSGIDIRFEFVAMTQPIRTVSGKVLLLVNQ